MPKFATPTGEIHYEILGLEAATCSLTLLHNFLSTGRTAWGPLLDALSQHYRILLPDLPGHGQSTGYPAGFHHTEMARQLQALMTETGFAAGHLAGCSGGGMVAELLVHLHLVKPASLLLVSTTHSTDPKRAGARVSLDPNDFRAGHNWLDRTAELHDPHQGAGYFYEHLLPAFSMLSPQATIDLALEELQAWNLPVCIIHGTEDELFPVAIAKRMVHALPNAEGHIIEGQSHSLLFRQPWRIQSIMIDFLARQQLLCQPGAEINAEADTETDTEADTETDTEADIEVNS